MIDGHHFALILLSYSEIITGVDRLIAPAHFGDVDQALNAWCDFKKRTIVFDVDNLAFDDAAFFDCITDNIPWMRLELFEAKRDSLLVLVKIKHHDMDFLIDLE